MDLLLQMNLKNAVERVLHVQGNYTGGILEMTLVIDWALPGAYVEIMAADVASVLRSHSEVFRNVRLNLLNWRGDGEMENQAVPISFLQMGTCFQEYQPVKQEKALENLAANLKLFHARSKLILVLAEEKLLIRHRELLARNMHPFLGKKSLFLCRNDPEMKWRRGEELCNPFTTPCNAAEDEIQ